MNKNNPHEATKAEQNLLDLISILTITTESKEGKYETVNTKPARDFLIDTYASYFDEVISIDEAILFCKRGIQKKSSLLINSHYDVVNIDDSWTRNPKGEMDQVNIYGRGASDMKGPMISALEGWKNVAKQGTIPNQDIYFLLVSDEEGSSQSVQRALGHPRLSSLTNCYAIVTEPTNLTVGVAQRGLTFYQLETTGGQEENGKYSPVHDGGPAVVSLPNAIELNLHVYESIRIYIQHLKPHPILGPSRVNLGLIAGGPDNRTQPNAIPNYCQSKFTLRYTPNQDFAAIHHTLQQICADFSKEKGIRIQLQPYEHYGGFSTNMESKIVHMLDNAAQSSIGPVEIGAYHAYSNADFLAKLGMTPVVFGPGDLKNGAHGTNEYISRSQFSDSIEIFKNLFRGN